MRNISLCLITILISAHLHAQQFCYPNGNVIIYSNYDGGYLNIDVDQNIPDLKIGITTYEKTEVHIFGQYVNNVIQVVYAGYNGNNDHCNPSPPTTNIFGVANSIDTIIIYPPVTWMNAAGWNYGILCNYSCDSINNQGGCNTPDQIIHYYITQFGGSLYYHYTQYGCWLDTVHVSDGGNCCIGASIIPPQFSIAANFSTPDDTVCAKDSVFFFNTTYNTYPGATTYSWDFGDGGTDTATNPIYAYNLAGTYTVKLIATASNGVSDTIPFVLTVIDCATGLSNSMKSQVKVSPNPATDWLNITTYSMHSNLQLFNTEGQQVLNLKSDEKEISLPVSQLCDGLYYLQVKTDQGIFWKKVVVAR